VIFDGPILEAFMGLTGAPLGFAVGRLFATIELRFALHDGFHFREFADTENPIERRPTNEPF